jgi:hypothetical protein
MADSKNPPVLPEGYDPELAKANKGFAALEKERAADQAKLDAQDQKAKDKAKALMDFGLGILKGVKEPVKKAKGGMISSASKRADGCAVRGKTRGRMV